MPTGHRLWLDLCEFLLVSILVLLDDAYRPPGLSERPRTKTVSILVLLDDAYRQLTQGLSLPQDSVSILVLLDDAYRHAKYLFCLHHSRQVSILVLLDDAYRSNLPSTF